MLTKAAHDVSDEPRDPHGRWTDGGGSDDSDGEGKHPGKGYSKGAYVDKDGVIQTNNVYDAQRALFEDRRVELKQPKQISTLIKRLGETAAEMAEHGETAPVFNLCLVTVKGTNLFCADQIGIPRAEMPVIPAKRTKDFIKHLKKLGYKIEKDKEQSRNLRASQSEISGAKVAAQMARIKDRGFYKRLVISRDDYILDGHHTWAGQLGIDAEDNDLENDDREVKVARVDISITKLIAEAEKWTKEEGIAKKPASEAPKSYQYMTLRQAQIVLPAATYQKFADTAYRFFAANGQLGRDLGDVLITVSKDVPSPEEFQSEQADTQTEAGTAHHDWMDQCVPELMSYGKDQNVAVAACLNMWRDAWAEVRPGEDDPGPPRPEERFDPNWMRGNEVRFDPNEPRDEQGRWTDGGGGDGGDSWRSDNMESFDLGKITDDVYTGKLNDGTGGFTKPEQDAIDQYKGQSRSFSINAKLRGGAISDEDRDVIAGIDSAMNRSSLSGDMNVWRTLHYHDWGGEHGPERGKIETEDFVNAGGFTDAGYVSTAGKPIGDEKTFKIVVPKGSKALIMKDTFQGYEGENEVILPRGSHFKYLGKDDAGQHTFKLLPSGSAKSLRREFDESKHPRVPAGSSEGGEFTSGGGGSDEASKDEATEPKLDPEVVDVGGDAWNKATAKRLEREYQIAKPKLEAITTGEATGSVPSPEETEEEEHDDDEDLPYVPDEWAGFNDSDQEDIKQEFFSHKLSEYYDSEVNSWWENGGAADEAKSELAGEFVSAPDWAVEAINDVRDDLIDDNLDAKDQVRIPFTNDQLFGAITLEYESNGEGTGDLNIDFDDEFLNKIKADPNQPTFAGIEPQDYSKLLTEDMRDALTKSIEKKFDKQADKADPEPPDYLKEQAQEFMEEDWEHNMSDDMKFDYATQTEVYNNLKELAEGGGSKDDDESAGSVGIQGVPTEFDPLNENADTNYKKTQWLARTLSIKRARQVIEERGLPYSSDQRMQKIDRQLWEAWKSSSTSEDGRLLQVAIADELGGRLNKKTATEIDADGLKTYADDEFKAIGGYAGIKAYVRAKWETTQYLLDKAGIQTLPLYRGLSLPDAASYTKTLKHYQAGQDIKGFKHMSTLDVLRNGAASTTTDRGVANGWVEYKKNPVVLRAEMPRTAAISVPAYGINIHSEREVVVAGTAWKGWDAWAEKAPSFDQVPLQKVA